MKLAEIRSGEEYVVGDPRRSGLISHVRVVGFQTPPGRRLRHVLVDVIEVGAPHFGQFHAASFSERKLIPARDITARWTAELDERFRVAAGRLRDVERRQHQIASISGEVQRAFEAQLDCSVLASAAIAPPDDTARVSVRFNATPERIAALGDLLSSHPLAAQLVIRESDVAATLVRVRAARARLQRGRPA